LPTPSTTRPQLANAPTGRVVDGVGNCRRDRHGGELTQTLGAERAGFFVELTNEQDVELRDICVRGYEVPGKVAVQEMSRERVHLGLLEAELVRRPR